MLSALPIILGIQFILAFLGQDIASVPRRPFHLTMTKTTRKAGDR